MAGYAIEISGLSKSYRGEKIFSNLSLSVKKGELLGVIGPDGSGKSPLFWVLATLITPDEGRVSIDGLDLVADYRKLRPLIGYMPEKFSLYQDLTVKENLDFFASVFNTTLEENYDLIKDIYSRLEPFADRKAGKLSGGMKQKLALCCALIHAPSVLLLDEPTTGVDPSSRREFWEMLSRLKEKSGITTIVSTAYMDEASRCDRVAMMHHGRLLKVGTCDSIISSFDKVLMSAKSEDMYDLLCDLKSVEGIEECYTFGGEHHIRIALESGLDTESLSRILAEKGHRNVSVNMCTPSMEDCFMNEASKADD
ncbi:MAG: ABC transporter ATP-binding protein [Bacteroidia bacterium]|nr:ABC transporter ATP-binding protein [Bacteroidia bacterium]